MDRCGSPSPGRLCHDVDSTVMSRTEQSMTCLSEKELPPHRSSQDRAPQLLVSVRNVNEARAALAGGADVVDVKEPTSGALGRASATVMQDIAAVVGGSPGIPCSVALGELLELPGGDDRLLVPDTVRWVKLGLSGCADQPSWLPMWADVRRRLNRNVGWIAVVYADVDAARSPAMREVLDAAMSTGCAGLLIDTFTKSGGSLLDFCSLNELQDIVTCGQHAGLKVALAGRVQLRDVPALVGLQPDLIAVRSAVCRQNDRLSAVDAEAVRIFRNAMRAASVSSGQ